MIPRTSVLLAAAFVALCSFAPAVVQSLASPASRSRKKSAQRRNASGSGGFAKAAAPEADASDQASKLDEAADAIAKRAVSNLFSVCSHIQDERLYQPKWADACKQDASDGGKTPSVIATRDVAKGHVLTLFPIHALGLRTLHRNTSAKKGSRKKTQSDTEFVAYDRDNDSSLFAREDQKAGLRMKLNIPLDSEQPVASVIGNRKRNVLFSMFFPEKPVSPGWLGGRMKSAMESNCVTVPLPGAAPLCAVVATKDVKEGDEIIQSATPIEPNAMEDLKSILAKEFRREIASLGMHIEMALDALPRHSDVASETGGEQLGPFHQINLQYPGLTQIHQDPDIYSIENFLSDDECDRIIAKASPHLQPCLVNNEKNGRVEQDPARTSTNTNLPQAEVPSVMEKIVDLARCDVRQVEILQVLNYSKGQQFVPHTDGFSGRFTACGFDRSSRLATFFCYLNDVGRGGCTYFPEIDLNIRPRKGTAVIHFPADVKMREDKRTLHQGKPAIDNKWLLTTWVWEGERTDEMYAESKLPVLDGDII